MMLAKLVALLVALSQQGFELIGNDRGINVYRHVHPVAIMLGAEGVIDAPPSVVREVLLDYANHPRWGQKLGVSQVLRREDHALDVYQRLALPIIADRDYTLHVTWGIDQDVQWMRFVTANERGPAPVPGVVRVKLNEGSWHLHSVDGGKATYAVYQFTLQLAGAMPPGLGSGQASRDIVKLFQSVRDQTQYYRWAAKN